MTKRRFYVLFSFLFVAVFALVCAITLTACGSDEGTQEEPPAAGDDGGETPKDTDEDGTGKTSEGPKLTGVTLDPETLALDLNGTTMGIITATIADSNYSYTWTGSEWSSSNEDVAKVSANGNEATVTAVGAGEATITVKLSETVSASCVVTVTDSSQSGPGTSAPTVESITLSAETLTLTLNEGGSATGTITATVTMSDSSEFNGNLEISEITGATFTQESADGVVTITVTAAEAVDAQTVTVSAGEKSASFTLEVSAYVAPGTEPGNEGQAIYTVTVSAPYNKERITVGDEMDLSVTVTDAQGDAVETTYGDISWSVDDKSVITLDEDTGHITGCGVGSAQITAKYTDSEGNYGSGVIHITVVSATSQATGDEYDIDVDFSQYEAKVGTDASVSFDEKGVVTYVDLDAKGSVTNGALSTGTFTYNNGTNYTNYILIDFTAFMGYNFEISVTFSGETGAILAVVDTLSEEDGQTTGGGTSGGGTGSRFGSNAPQLSDLVDAQKGAAIATGTATFRYSGQISTVSEKRGNVNDIIYIVWDSAISISEITVELWTGDKQVTLDENWAGLNIDFSNPPESFREYYEELNSGAYQGGAATVVLEDGVLTLIDSDNDTNWTSGQRYMETKYESGIEDAEFEATGYTHESVYDLDDMGITNYFAVSLHGLEGKEVTITVVFSTADGAEGTMYIVDTLEGFTADHGTLIGTALASASGTKDKKLSAAVTVPSDGMLYIEYNTAMYIYSIKIEIGGKVDTEPVYSIEIDTNGASTTVTAGEQGLTITARVYKDGSEDGTLTVEWKSDNPEIANIENGTVTGVSEGETYVYAVFTWGEEEGGYIESGKIKITVRAPVEEGSGNIFIDFSDYSTWGYLESVNGTQDLSGDGKLKFVPSTFSGGAGDAIPHMTEVDGTYALQLGTAQDYGATSAGMSGSTGTKSNYFIIDTSEATAMTVTIKFSKINASATDGYVALIGTNPDNITMATLGSTKSTRFNQISSHLIASDAYADTNGTSTVTFTYTADVSSRNAVYIVLGTAMYIYSIDITLSDEVHEHIYQITGEWTWNEDYTKCYADATCTGETGICSAPTATVYAEVASDITYATCETDGSASYTATYDGKVVGTATVTYGTATGHEIVGTYSDGTWTYACANDSAESFENIESVEGKINSITLVAGDETSFVEACEWNVSVEVTPIVHVTTGINVTTNMWIYNTAKDVLLDADIIVSSRATITIYTTTTIDLNGHTIGKTTSGSDTSATIQIGVAANGVYGDVTIKDSSGEGTGKIVGDWYAITLFGDTNAEGKKTVLTICGGSVTANAGYAISTNAIYPEISIYMYGGTVSGAAAHGIFLSAGELYLYDGLVSGYTGIEVRGGKAYIMGGTVTSVADKQEDVDESESNGSVADGYAIAITWNESYSADALIEISGASVTVNGVLYASRANASRFDIFAGTFSVKPDETFIRDGFAAVEKDGYYVVETNEEAPEEEKVVLEEIHVDFGEKTTINSELMEYMDKGTAGTTAKVDVEGHITYNDEGWESMITGEHLETLYVQGGLSSGGITTGEQNYFIIDLSSYIGSTAEVSLKVGKYFSWTTGIVGFDTSVYSMEDVTEVPSTMLASLTNYADSGTEFTLTWEIEGDGILYLMYSQPIYIYSIDIVIEGVA